jgi:ABC-type branched-subunit amino acid transport system ATPase component/ABC-type branched-subunit amino acid transport system permease subunit
MTDRATTIRRVVGPVLLLVAGLCLPLVLGTSDFRLSQLEYIGSLTMIAIGLDIVTGFAGQLSLGPGAVFAIAGYGVVIYANHFPTQASLPLLCLIGVGLALVAGFVVGMPALRVGGFYLGMTTLFLALLVPDIAQTLSITGGDQGISLVSNIDFTQSPSGMTLYIIMVLVVALIAVISWGVLYSRVGHRLLTLRTSEDLAASLGIPGYKTKLLAFLLSSVPAGLAGAFYVYTQQFFTPNSATPQLSIYLLAGCVIGGFGTVAGPIIGTALVFSLQEFLGSFNQYQGIVFGVALLAVIWAIPDGLVSASLWRKARDLVVRKKEIVEVAPASEDLYVATGGQQETTVDLSLLTPDLDGDGAAAAAVLASELVVKGARRSFGGVVAVAGVDLTVKPGRIHALIGPNGSGKTTLLNLISGFYRLEGGTVELGGERIDGHGAAFVARSGIGRTFQTPKLLTDKDVRYNVVVAADFSTKSSDFESVFRLPRGRRARREAVQLSDECLRQLGLLDLAPELSGKMPHGIQRLVEVARAMALRPHIYLLDEPAAGLSQYEVEIMKSVVRGLAATGAGVLLVEHNLPLVLDLADEITVLHRGERIAYGPPDVVAADEQVARVYLGRETVGAREGAPVPAVEPVREGEMA